MRARTTYVGWRPDPPKAFSHQSIHPSSSKRTGRAEELPAGAVRAGQLQKKAVSIDHLKGGRGRHPSPINHIPSTHGAHQQHQQWHNDDDCHHPDPAMVWSSLEPGHGGAPGHHGRRRCQPAHDTAGPAPKSPALHSRPAPVLAASLCATTAGQAPGVEYASLFLRPRRPRQRVGTVGWWKGRGINQVWTNKPGQFSDHTTDLHQAVAARAVGGGAGHPGRHAAPLRRGALRHRHHHRLPSR